MRTEKEIRDRYIMNLGLIQAYYEVSNLSLDYKTIQKRIEEKIQENKLISWILDKDNNNESN